MDIISNILYVLSISVLLILLGALIHPYTELGKLSKAKKEMDKLINVTIINYEVMP